MTHRTAIQDRPTRAKAQADGAPRPTYRRRAALAQRVARLLMAVSAVGGLGAVTAVGLGGLGAVAAAHAANTADSVDLDTARAEHEAGRALLIDIREPSEHAYGVAAGAKLLPMRQLDTRLGEIPADPNQPVLLICNTQNRSKAVLDRLREQGYRNVRYVEGGMSGWSKRGWPMVPPPGMSVPPAPAAASPKPSPAASATP